MSFRPGAWDGAAGPRTSTSGGSAVRHLVQGDGHGEQQRLVLTRADLDAVGLADPEPLLRDPRDRVAVPLDLVLVVEDVPVRLEILSILDLDLEPIPDADERLVDRRHRPPVALDRHRVAHVELALLDLRHLAPGAVLEHERLADAQRLPVDLVDPVAVLVLDPGVIPDRRELLPHLEAPDLRSVAAMPQESHARTLAPRVPPEHRPKGMTPGARDRTDRQTPT